MLTAAPASAISITFTPSSTHLSVGDSVTIDMTISGLGDEILSGFDFNAFWDSTVVAWQVFGLAVVGQLGPDPYYDWDGLFANSVGAVGSSTLSDNDLAAIQPDSFLLAQFKLKGIADGVTTFGLGADPDFERNFTGRDFLTLNVDVGSACIAVGTGSCEVAVPEPGTLGLLGIGLLGLGLGRRRLQS